MRYYGKVGYCTTVEVRPGVWDSNQIVERPYYGDVLRFTRRQQTADKVNDDLEISNQISILADPYAYDHFSEIRYVTWMGVKWKVPTVEVEYPRLRLTVGGVYTENDES